MSTLSAPPLAAPSPADALWLRLGLVAACGSSGAILVAKSLGWAEMHAAFLLLCVPGLALTAAAWAWARRTHSDYTGPGLALGLWGGLLGTVGYDVVRIPFALAGQRVFAPISAYGIWLLDAEQSSPLTELAGWSYHFYNGASFGMMYGLVARRRRWGWAIAWALALETIMVVTPLGRIFRIAGNYPALAIAYAAHLAYGLPLGWLVWRWDQTVAGLAAGRRLLGWGTGIGVAGVLLYALSAQFAPRPEVPPATFVVEGTRLAPEWLRVQRDQEVTFRNPGDAAVTIHLEGRSQTRLSFSPRSEVRWRMWQPGIARVYVQTEGRTRSSFVIVEPVHERDDIPPPWSPMRPHP